MRILKFGGTSVAGPARLRGAARIVAGALRRDAVLVVVSAQAGVTDALAAATDRGRRAGLIEELTRRHLGGLDAVGGPGASHAAREVHNLLANLRSLLDNEPETDGRPGWRDAVLATGERLSVHLMTAALTAAGLRAGAVDAGSLIATDSGFGEASVDAKATRERVRSWLSTFPEGTVPVTAGFIGADAEGRTTTLGRGGSDYSAAVVGAALGAEGIEIWTDVEGVLSAPPRIVPEAVPVPALSFGVAREVALLGGKVLHPRTMEPAEAARIPIAVRSSLAPGRPGTLVGPASRRTAAARVVTGLEGVAMVTAAAPAGPQPGASLAACLQEAGITVLGFGQTGSCHVRIAVPEGEAERSRELVAARLGRGPVESRGDQCVVALVGDGIGTDGEATFARLLDRLHLPALAVLRRPSPDSVVAVLRGHFLRRAITTLHETLVLGGPAGGMKAFTHRWDVATPIWQGGRP